MFLKWMQIRLKSAKRRIGEIG